MSAAPFHDPARFPFIAELERHWREIYAEFLTVEGALIDYVEPELYDQGWKVFGLWNLPHREPLKDGVLLCPRTAALVERLVPSHGAVAFSVLKPGTTIHPHTGVQGPYLRGHLALEVPAGDCAIRVAGEERRWTAGRTLVLDDRLVHEAWNRTPERRVVMLFDFIP